MFRYIVPPMGDPQLMLLLPHCSAGRNPKGFDNLGCRLPASAVRAAGAPAAALDCRALDPLCSMLGRVLLPLLPGLNRSSPDCLRCTAEGSLRARLLLSEMTVGVFGRPPEAGSDGEDSAVPSAPGK